MGSIGPPAPDLFSYIQAILDEHPHPGRFVLTGSQNFLLLEKISQSLAGRVAIFRLPPFSFAEPQHTIRLPDQPVNFGGILSPNRLSGCNAKACDADEQAVVSLVSIQPTIYVSRPGRVSQA